MKIQIKIRQIDLADTMDDLIEQMSYYNTRTQDGVVCLMGDRFNIYLHNETSPVLSDTMRLLEILPKDTPV